MGAVGATAFMVDMNEVFETFVVSALRDALELSASTLVQGAAIASDEDLQVTLRPDLTWWDRARPAFVGDVKYRALDARGYRHADLYQLLAYSVATDLPGGLLIYAKGEGMPGTYRVTHAGRTLEVHWLDVSGSPEDILMSFTEMAMVIRRLRGARCTAPRGGSPLPGVGWHEVKRSVTGRSLLPKFRASFRRREVFLSPGASR